MWWALALLALLGACGLQYSKETWHDMKCREYGLKRGTEAYGNCRATLEAGTLAGKKD